jgi:hypothetical protein
VRCLVLVGLLDGLKLKPVSMGVPTFGPMPPRKPMLRSLDGPVWIASISDHYDALDGLVSMTGIVADTLCEADAVVGHGFLPCSQPRRKLHTALRT